MKDTCYLVLQHRGKHPSSAKFSIIRAAKNRPKLRGDELALKLTVMLPDNAFRCHFLQADIAVEERHIVRPKAAVSVEEPLEGDHAEA